MVYKLGNVSDLEKLMIADETTYNVLHELTSVLTNEYGADRNVNEDDGGYVLFATLGTKPEEIKAFFDYTANLVEFVDVQDDVCSALFILSSDYGVVIITSLADTPPEILKEI